MNNKFGSIATGRVGISAAVAFVLLGVFQYATGVHVNGESPPVLIAITTIVDYLFRRFGLVDVDGQAETPDNG